MRRIVTIDNGRAEFGTITFDNIPVRLPSGETRYSLDAKGDIQFSFSYSCEPEDFLSDELIYDIAEAISHGMGIGRAGGFRWRI